MIADMINNNKLEPVVTELFIRIRKLNIYLVFITQSYFTATKDNRKNSMHYFITKTPNQRELQQIAFNHSFLVTDTTFASYNTLLFRKNVLERI